ncbi:unnamed protein product [Pieris macdunnoughi]|uniref:unspecific monooxygenase n=1 Tax=Pieris macdunnoughi TaxID=345717 RepID=A0A821Y7L4_9NEOP|nr:unnamed protein product [Pieris macdunnoughi]
MFGIIVCGVTVFLISWIYLRWRNVREYWARRGVPHSPPHPLMGSLTFLQQKNPEKLYAELVEAKDKCANNSLDINTLADLQYLNCVIKEALRKYSPMGWMDRVALVDYKIDDKLTIPAGTPLYVNAIGMQYYEEFYPEPEKFDPDRFLPENEKESLQFTYLPFGEGPRNCIGKRFAQISLRSALAKLVLNYEFRPLPGQPKPSEIDIDKLGLFYVPSHHLNLDFIRR